MKKVGLIPLFLLILVAGTGCYKHKSVPVADFSYSVDTIPHSIIFRNLSQNAVSYKWTFGDGGSSTETDPVHVYADSGAYDVLLKAYSKGDAEWAQTTKTVHVK
jgi:PKD repeat protein